MLSLLVCDFKPTIPRGRSLKKSKNVKRYCRHLFICYENVDLKKLLSINSFFPLDGFPDGPQIPPGGPQMPPRWLPDAPKIPPDAPQMAPRCPQIPPGGSQIPPRWPPDAPQMPQDAPRCPPDAPRSPQVAPRCPPDVPRCRPHAPQMLPDVPQMPPDVPQMSQDAPHRCPPGLLCGISGRPSSTNVWCPHDIGRDSWDRGGQESVV